MMDHNYASKQNGSKVIQGETYKTLINSKFYEMYGRLAYSRDKKSNIPFDIYCMK